ncbi:uncharacterized protein [Argopecten irradians]|uniref:uncharacterized protein n=1 Tax=Argopecten irradians TaxID=31199 RepID=UPI0037122E69
MEKRKESSEVKTDVKLLLECLQYQADNSSATKQALFTLASIFSNYEGSKDHFRNIGGLNYVFNIITSTTNSEVQESAFYCLGCCIENNVFCQKSLTSNSVFVYIHGVLSNTKCPTRLKQTATFFLLNLVSNNGQGQTLVRSTGCLSDLLQLLRSSFPKTEVFNRQSATESWFEDVGTTSVELWSSVASTLCMCVNNPRNDENQSRCGLELGFMFTLIQHCDNPSILRPLLSLVGFTVASNASTQRQVRQCGGLVVLIARLKVALDLALQQNSESESHRAQISIAITIAGTIDSCILDNAENAEDLSKGDAIPSMMQLLLLGSLKQEDKLQVVLTLGHMLELSSESRTRIDEVTGLPDLVKLLTESEDEEFSKAVKYLLQMCIARNEKNQIEVEEENLEAVRRENGKKMLLRIDEISERLKVIEKEAEEKSLLMQQTAQGLETVNTTHRDAMSLTPREKGLLFQLQQERDDRQRMEFLALHMHAPSPRTHQYGLIPRQCLSEENYHLQGRSILLQSDGQGLNHQTFCCNTSEVPHYQKHNLDHHGPCSMNNCPEYSKGIQTDGRGSCILGLDGNTTISHNLTKQQRSGKEVSLQENNAPSEAGMYGQSGPISRDIQMESFPQNKNHGHHCLLDHRGDRNADGYFSESYRLCPTSYKYDVGLNKGEGNTKVIDKEADSTVEVSCEGRMRGTTTNNINSVSSPGTETELVTQRSMHEVSQDQAVIQRSNSSRDLSSNSTSKGMGRAQKKAPFVEKDSRTHHQETITNISGSGLQVNSLNSSSAENHRSSGQCEINSSGTKSFTESERKDVFLKPKPPSIASCYRTPVKRPSNTRMTPSLGNINRSNSLVRHKHSFVRKPVDEESYPDSDCSSVMDTRSEFDLDLMKTAKKNTFSQNICYSVTPLRREYCFNKTDKFSVQKVPSYIGGTPCSVKSIVRMKDHGGESINDSCSDSFSSEEDDWSDVENSETEENMECHDDHKPSEELKDSKCPGCTVWLNSPSNSKHMLMNSRTYNLLLETSLYTCDKHKAIRDCERKFIQKIRKNSKVISKKRHLPPITTRHIEDTHPSRNTMSVYEFRTSESESDGRVTPPYSINSCKINLESLRNVIPRRSRIPYTEEEVENIMTGVSQFGTRWNQILVTYKFHASRTATDLKDKYKRQVVRNDF